ncbi:hypothetical protein Clacol_004798 [Clathrus columnatus]|uniref:galacturonan 1,4-alpha-galacturonidase n=1 Tax=Clathrus columnatus TaxID=1419009 RepID=A0AAV5AC24_9AGAM|nr:hypothetical protein Clacol_004798 [Clathrus columnatus]
MVRLAVNIGFILASVSVLKASLDNASGSLTKRLASFHPPLPPKSNNSWLTITGNTCHVRAKGAAQDDGPTILDAFSLCNNNHEILLDEYYVVNTVMNTTGLSNVQIQLSGTIQYTPNIAYWSANSIPLIYQNATTFWLLGGTNLHLFGGGTIDGNGQIWWDTFASNGEAGVAGGSSTVFARPVPLTIGNTHGALIEDLNIVYSPFWNNFVINSTNVEYRNISLRSVSFSSSVAANTDGWDIYRSCVHPHLSSEISLDLFTALFQRSCHYKGFGYCQIPQLTTDRVSDDDCVSLKPNSTNILVSNLNCNGSHGTSIGSLGQFAGETDIVENVLIENIVMANAQNGARIKVFGGNPSPTSVSGGGTGFVKNVTFSNYRVDNVDNPILIDQCYETAASVCAEFPSQLSISDVHYKNITGTASAAEKGVVVSLECSQPCNDITAQGINIVPPAPFHATFLCSNITSINEVRIVNDIEHLPKVLDAEPDKGDSSVGEGFRLEVMVIVATPSSEELDASVGAGVALLFNVELREVVNDKDDEFETEGVGSVVALLVVVEPNPMAITGTADVVSEKRLVVVIVLCWSSASMIIFSQMDVPP